MPRFRRKISPNRPVEVTTKTIHGMYLLPPTRQFQRVVVGALVRAQELYPVAIHAFAGLPSHIHLLVTPTDGEELADFMRHFNGNLAREVCHMIPWSDRIWGHRYHAIEITAEQEVLESRLDYVLSHGVKEGLVERVADWEGLHCAQALIDGTPLHGVWYDRTTKYMADRLNQEIERDAWVHDCLLELSPLPCWVDRSPTERRKLVTAMVEELETKIGVSRNRPVKGMAIVQRQAHTGFSATSEKSPPPAVHAGSRRVRKIYEQARREFENAYTEASIELRVFGKYDVEFPRWSFRPSLPFVREGDDFTPFPESAVFDPEPGAASGGDGSAALVPGSVLDRPSQVGVDGVE